MNRTVYPIGYRTSEPVREPELFSVNYPPAVVEVDALLKAKRLELAAARQLIAACLAIRSHDKPSREDVLKALDAVESMAYSFSEQGQCFGDLESAFEKLRGALDVRRPRSYEQAKFDATAAWNGVPEDEAGV